MSYPINYPTPQGANVQKFYKTDDWVKPQGASFVWFTLIGAGSGGDGSSIGGSTGAVTNCMVPAFLIPDTLNVVVGRGGTVGNPGTASSIKYQQKDGSGYTLLEAGGGVVSSTRGATSSNFFSAIGIYQSVGGAAGATGAVTASTTTFLSGGSLASTEIVGNYGYSSNKTGSNGGGIFQMQPIIVGTGGAGTGKGGVGCGGGNTGVGGDGLVVIITW